MSSHRSRLILIIALTLIAGAVQLGCDSAAANLSATEAEDARKPGADKKESPAKSKEATSEKVEAPSEKAKEPAPKEREEEREARADSKEGVEDRAVPEPGGDTPANEGEVTPSAPPGGPGAEPQGEEARIKEADQDRRDGRDPVPQERPDTAAVNSLGSVLKDVKSLVVAEHDIPFKVLKFGNSRFSITDPTAIAVFIEAAGQETAPMESCPRCVTTFTVTAKDARGQDLAHLEMYCGGAVSTPLINNTFTEQCWTVKDGDRMKALLETASR